MTDGEQLRFIAALAGAGLLFLVEIALSMFLEAAASLSRVAMRRMVSDAGSRLAFLEEMRDPSSSHRMALGLLRQFCLLGAVLLTGFSVRLAGGSEAVAALTVVLALVVILLVDLLVVRVAALWDPRGALRRTTFLVRPAVALLYPVVRPAHLLLSAVRRTHANGDEEREEEQEEEVEAFIEVGEREGILEADEGAMMRNVAELDEILVREIMTPRTDIVALPLETGVSGARKAILEAGHSRLPVFSETIDNVVGILHERDLLLSWEQGNGDRPIQSFLREAMFVPETLTVASLLADMRVKNHIAVVVDEYGGVAGLITLEDLLEEIVGDIRDEHDREEDLVRKDADDRYVVNGAAHVDELTELFGVEFEDREFDTVGGLVVASLGRVPHEGEVVETHGLHIEVLKADRRRIREVRIRPGSAPDEAQALP